MSLGMCCDCKTAVRVISRYGTSGSRNYCPRSRSAVTLITTSFAESNCTRTNGRTKRVTACYKCMCNVLFVAKGDRHNLPVFSARPATQFRKAIHCANCANAISLRYAELRCKIIGLYGYF